MLLSRAIKELSLTVMEIWKEEEGKRRRRGEERGRREGRGRGEQLAF